MPTEYGTMTYNAGFCGDEDGGFSEDEINIQATFLDPSVIVESVNVYTTLGERVWSGHNISNDLILQQNWSELSINNLPYSGVYFIEKFSSDKRLTEKIFISNHK